MFDWVNGERLWILTNQIMGVVTVVAAYLIGRDVVRGVRLQLKPRERRVLADDHAFDIAGLGLTMADGGERRTAEKGTTDAGKPGEEK